MMKKSPARRLPRLKVFDYFNLAFLTLVLLLIAYPFYNSIVLSLLTQRGYVEFRGLLPTQVTFQAYEMIFAEGWVLTGYGNSILITVAGTAYSMLITTMCAYGFSRPKFLGRNVLMMFFLITLFFGGGLIPSYLQIKELGLMDTLWALILPSGMSVFYMLLMRNFFGTIPVSLKEAAMLDGAGEWRVLWRIVLPLSMPILATIALFCMVDRWNTWYNAMLYIRSPERKPLQLCLREIINASSSNTSNLISAERAMLNLQSYTMASVVVTMLPIMLVYPFLQKYFVKGIVLGGVKE